MGRLVKDIDNAIKDNGIHIGDIVIIKTLLYGDLTYDEYIELIQYEEI